MILCDAAQISDGKLNILGGCWSTTYGKTPYAIALAIDLDEADLGIQHSLTLRMIDDNQGVFQQETPSGRTPLEIQALFHYMRPPSFDRKIPLTISLTFGVLPTQMIPNEIYTWECFVNGKIVAQRSFLVLQGPLISNQPASASVNNQ